MLERLALDRHAQPRHVGEVRLTQLARLVLLREEDLLGRALQRQPDLDATLQGACES